jgi:hypothetical protein
MQTPTEKEPQVLVIDFFLGSPGVSSSLGTSLADRFSESLANSSRKIEMIDREESCRISDAKLDHPRRSQKLTGLPLYWP